MQGEGGKKDEDTSNDAEEQVAETVGEVKGERSPPQRRENAEDDADDGQSEQDVADDEGDYRKPNDSWARQAGGEVRQDRDGDDNGQDFDGNATAARSA